MSELLDLATAAARKAGAYLAPHAGAPGSTGTKSSNVDMVTEYDIGSGALIAAELMAGDPDTPLLVEEPEVYGLTGAREGTLDDEVVWVVDPIDGTTSFIHGWPAYSVSIARVERGRVVLGVVYNVPMDELFAAETGRGATRNGEPISASDSDSIDRALLVTGFPYDRGQPLTRQLTVLNALLRSVHGIRRDGTAALDCCHVACGRADGFWEYALKPWDTNAGMLVAIEAGAVASSVSGEPWTPATADVIVAAPDLHPVLLKAIRSVDPDQA